MNYNLKKPCDNCPFRSDKLFMLDVDRIEQIASSDGSFPCHKTVDYSEGDGGKTTKKSEHCAGLLIMLENMVQPNQMMRIAERLGVYDYKKLDMNAPVYDHVDDYINAINEATNE